jgi:hypothetical protein
VYIEQYILLAWDYPTSPFQEKGTDRVHSGRDRLIAWSPKTDEWQPFVNQGGKPLPYQWRAAKTKVKNRFLKTSSELL